MTFLILEYFSIATWVGQGKISRTAQQENGVSQRCKQINPNPSVNHPIPSPDPVYRKILELPQYYVH